MNAVPKRALICGISGQDGSYLARYLLGRGYEVWGSSRDAELNTFQNLRQLGILSDVRLVSLNSGDVPSIIHLLKNVRPDELYSLAGQTSVGLSFEQPVETMQSIALGTLNLLEGVRLSDLDIRFYNAGSSECFGDTGDGRANESSPFRPGSPYAIAKAAAFWTVANYRTAHGLFACTGILANHESPLRPRRFVTRKIIHAVASIALGRNVHLTLGNLEIKRDWGWAPEFVEAIALLLAQAVPEDYIIATGTSHTLTEFVDTAFQAIGKDWREHTTLQQQLMRPADLACVQLDVTKARTRLGWAAQTDMARVIQNMLEAEMAALRAES